jgi:hypothetical protein
MSAIHAPIPGAVKQASLPPVNLAMEVPAIAPADRTWYSNSKGNAKAAWGNAFLITGGSLMLVGLYLWFRYSKSEYTLDEADQLVYRFYGLYIACVGGCLLIPGFILRMNAGSRVKTRSRF